ncbi:ABC transporter permease [Arenibaculum pallidiluteum]|uniref:ABC transporter permease n=1 Tax=Arenibaculum pallidiluteum TaxID=2812559 RepID=UPI001A95C8FE|nr:ABC transporter permease subunit [Arenibaculum pallidiluteum]
MLRRPGFLGTTLLLVRREASAKLASPWFYGVASVVCLTAWAYGTGFVKTFETESVLVTTDPLMGLNVVVVTFLGLVLGLRLSSSIAWEREHRTLDVLIAGPVSFEAVLLAKFLVELCVFAALMGSYFLYLLLAQPLGAGVVGFGSALSAGQMTLCALPTLVLGLLVSAWARTVRGAVVAYLILVGLLGLFEIVLGLLRARPPEELSLGAAYLKEVLEGAATILHPVSAVGGLGDLAEALAAQSPLLASHMLSALALTAAGLILATALLRIRGALA